MKNIIVVSCFKATNADGGICADDFKLTNTGHTINLKYFVSMSSLLLFRMPFTGNGVDYYAIIMMTNGIKYYIRKSEFIRISELIKQKT